MYLVDTNIWLERLLDQERSAEVGRFLDTTATEQLLMSDFTLHSIGLILTRLGRGEVLLRFVDDVFVTGGVTLASLQPEFIHQVVGAMDRFKLDFDDAYQYLAAEQAQAVIVSYDDDFDRIVRGRTTPAQVLNSA